MDIVLMTKILEEVDVLAELKVLEDMFERKGFSKEVVAAAIKGASEEVLRQYREKEMAKRPPPGLTKKQQMKWCVDNGGHWDRGGMFFATCARCPYEEDVDF